MSTDAGSVRVSIFNQSYSLRSASGDGAHVLRVARLVDERMRAVASGLAVHDVAKVAVLTALNLADELEGLKSFYEAELREMLARAHEEELARAREEEAAASASVADTPAPQDSSQGGYDHEPTRFAEPHAAEGSHARDEQSWFEAIFNTDASPPRTGDDRLSSQVSARLRRLRQPPAGNAITEGEGDEP